MGSFDQLQGQGSETTEEPAGIPERIGDRADEHVPDAASDGAMAQPDQPAQGDEGARDSSDSSDSSDASAADVGMDGPGVPESAQAAAGPTQATTSGSGPAPAAGQDETHAGLTDSVAASEDAAGAPAGPGATGEPGANGGLSSAADPLSGLAQDLGLEPGASDAYDAGQDNGLNS